MNKLPYIANVTFKYVLASSIPNALLLIEWKVLIKRMRLTLVILTLSDLKNYFFYYVE